MEEMNLEIFLDKIQNSLKDHLNNFELMIQKNNLPRSIEFIVLSSSFDNMDRGDRIMFMAGVVQETFGLPLTFTPAGLALTFKEAKELSVV